MSMRLRACSLALISGALPSSAFASFDLLLQADQDASGFAEIDRYDPVSKIYLGSFSIIGSMPTSIAASTARGELYTRVGSNTVDVYNYSTGDYLRTIRMNGGALGVSADGQNIQSIHLGNLISVNAANGLASGSVALTGMTTTGNAFSLSPSGAVIVADDAGLAFKSFSAGGALISSSAYTGGVTAVKQLASRVGSVGSIGSNTNSFLGTSNIATTLYGVTEATTGVLSGTSRGTGLTTNTAALNAHNGMYFVGVNGAVLRMAPMTSGNVIGAGFNLTQTTNLTGTAAIVLAPEPATMAALGLGVAALLRKRRK